MDPDRPMPDLLTIESEHAEDLPADGADLVVSVEGTSFFTGRAALSKAREVRALVEALGGIGVDESQIGLRQVRAKVSTGFLGKSSAATYVLRIVLPDLDRIADALDAITSQKNTDLREIIWRYPDHEAARQRWLAAAIRAARARADAAAEALGVKIVGVHRCTEQLVEEAPPPRASAGLFDEEVMPVARRARASAASVGAELGGFELVQTKRAGVRVQVQFRLGPSGSDEGARGGAP